MVTAVEVLGCCVGDLASVDLGVDVGDIERDGRPWVAARCPVGSDDAASAVAQADPESIGGVGRKFAAGIGVGNQAAGYIGLCEQVAQTQGDAALVQCALGRQLFHPVHELHVSVVRVKQVQILRRVGQAVWVAVAAQHETGLLGQRDGVLRQHRGVVDRRHVHAGGQRRGAERRCAAN